MTDTIAVTITKEIQAPVEKVFAAWTRPELLKEWFVPGNVMYVATSEVELKVGGGYLIHMHNPEDNSDHIVSGSYEEIRINERIVFDWMWKGGVDRTVVTVEFTPKSENETLITLTHSGFSEQEFADRHTEGWHACMANLESVYSAEPQSF